MSAPAATAEPLDRRRLAMLLGMLGSEFPGERSNAGRAADRLVREAGLTWHQVLAPTPKPPSLAPQGELDIGTAIALCRENISRLTPWEQRFFTSLQYPRRPLSVKQSAIVVDVSRRVQDELRSGFRYTPPPRPPRRRRTKRRGTGT